MKKMFFSAGMLILVSQLPAQRLFVANNPPSDQHNAKLIADEKTFSPDAETRIPARLIESIPVAKNRQLVYFSRPEGKRTALLRAVESGEPVFTTQYRRHQLHGIWIGHYKTGYTLDSGNFIRNVPDGEWKSWYPNGKLRSIRNYSSTKFAAVTNEISRRNEKIIYHSLSKLGMLHPARYEHITSAAYSFSNLPSGHGLLYTAPFVNCLHHGLYMNFYPSGAIRDSGYYKDGLRDGIWDEFYENGQLKVSGYYFKGQKNSGWKYYTIHGRLAMLSEYKNGNLIHRKKYE